MAHNSTPLCYIDPSVYFDLISGDQSLSKLDGTTSKADLAKQIFDQVCAGDVTLCASPLVIVEVGFKSQDDPKKQEILDSLKKLMYMDSTRWIDVERTVADLAISRGAEWILLKADPGSNKMGPNDVIHLASAIRLKAQYFFTSDGGFPIGYTIDKVKIEYAHSIGTQRLPFG